MVGLATVFGAGGGTVVVPRDRGHRRHRPVGLERPRRPPDLLPPRARRRSATAPRCSSSTRAARSTAQLADRLARPRRRHRHRPGQHRRARDHPRRAGQHRLRRARRPPASTSTPPRSSRGRSSAAPRSPASRPTPSASSPTPTPAPTAPSCAGRSASPSTTTPSTTCSRSSTWPCSCGHVGRYGSGLNPLRGQNNVQGGGDMGAIPNRLPGFQDVLDDDAARASSRRPGAARSRRATAGTSPQMFEAMERGDLRALYVIGENPAQSEADVTTPSRAARRPRPPRRAGHLPHQDGASWPTSCCPAIGGVVRDRGHGHQLRAPGAAGAARRSTRRARPATTSRSCIELARALGHDWDYGSRRRAEDVWNELRRLSPMHAGHELRPPRGARRHPVAVLPRGPPRADATCTAGCGPTTRPSAGRPAPFSVVVARAAGRRARRRVPAPPHHRPPARLATTPACSPAATAPPPRAARPSTCRPRTPPRLGVGEGEVVRVVVPAGHGRGAGARRPRAAARAWCS